MPKVGDQLGIRLNLRMTRSKLRAGATRYTALMVRAVVAGGAP
jgi:hypothetical protein